MIMQFGIKYYIDVSSLYTNSLIDEPLTFYKNDAFVQLIRVKPNYLAHNVVWTGTGAFSVEYSENDLHNLVSNVDLSCCAVSFFPNNVLKSYHDDVIVDCTNKQFKVLEKSAFYNKKRIDHRIHKLVSRGWKDCTPIFTPITQREILQNHD